MSSTLIYHSVGKYIFVTGGVCSSLGKGVTTASLGSLLECYGFTVRLIKIDPYINVDAGTISPYQHGEVYVTDDGAESDLDLGNYARYTDAPISREHSITAGQIYQEVIQRERKGDFLGKTVQVIPHITDYIKERIVSVGSAVDVAVTFVEIGGTVGDIESVPFLEAARQMIYDLGRDNVIAIHLTLIPEITGGELKTKPTQHSVRELQEIGIQPDFLVCRTPTKVTEDLRHKLSLFTNVASDAVISAHDVEHSIYELPLMFKEQKFDESIVSRLRLKAKRSSDVSRWEKVAFSIRQSRSQVTIALVGKYIHLSDAYKSIDEALLHGSIVNGVSLRLKKVDSENITSRNCADMLSDAQGILIPGGFGHRGIEGMIAATCYARANMIPYFGICVGMQIMMIEYARNIMGLYGANSVEFDPKCEDPVIILLADQVESGNYGGTMRLGENNSVLASNTRIFNIYRKKTVNERHRHRYEVSNKYRKAFQDHGLVISGLTKDEALVETIEWPDHPWGIGVQYHPEFKSKPWSAHPLFVDFIRSASEYSQQ